MHIFHKWKTLDRPFKHPDLQGYGGHSFYGYKYCECGLVFGLTYDHADNEPLSIRLNKQQTELFFAKHAQKSNA
jgi:hypothetical protein